MESEGDIEPIEIIKYIQKFLSVLTKELVQQAEIPAAFAILMVNPVSDKMAQFNILTGASPQLLPRGKEEAEQMLKDALRNWERVNYPADSCIHHWPTEGGHA